MSDLSRVVGLGRSGRGRTVLAVVLGLVAEGAAVALAGTSAWLITRASERPPVLHLMVAVVAVRAFGIGRGVFRYAERLAAHDGALRVLTDLRATVVRRVARVLPGDARLRRGDLLARFVGDVDGLMDVWVRVLVPGSVALAVAGAAVAVVSVVLPPAGLAAAAAISVALVAVPGIAAAVGRRTGAGLAAMRGRLHDDVVTLLDSAAELTVYGAMADHLDRVEEDDRSLRSAERRVALAAGAANATSVAAAGGGAVMALWIAAPAVADGSLSAPALAVVVLMPLAVHELIALLTPAAAELPAQRASARRLLEVLDRPDPVAEPASPAAVPAGSLGLHLDGVAIGWPDGDPLLHDLSFDVGAGERVALVGASGIGKSTLAATLLRFVEPRAGAIHLLGAGGAVPLAGVAGDEVRRAIGWCSQDAHVFDSTLAANVRLARPDASDDDLLAALTSAQMADWVAGRPDGLATMVGAHGDHLSGGEQQRVALARVLLAGHRVVVIDEPTEHLDDTTAKAVLRDMTEALQGRTLLVITHRLDLVEPFVDRVITLGWLGG